MLFRFTVQASLAGSIVIKKIYTLYETQGDFCGRIKSYNAGGRGCAFNIIDRTVSEFFFL